MMERPRVTTYALLAGLALGAGLLLRAQIPAAGVYAPQTFFASYDLTGQSANFPGGQVVSAAPFTGFYRLTCFILATQAATTSSTTPQCNFAFSKLADTGGMGGYGYYGSGNRPDNVVGYAGSGPSDNIVYLAAGSSVTVNGVGYASSGATPMLYSVHVRVEYVGQ